MGRHRKAIRVGKFQKNNTMKKIFMTVIAIMGFALTIMAQAVSTFTINGNTYYGTKAIPKEITGLYKYEKVKEPIVEINENGTGFFTIT